uniref:Uncharacterized protein n=1 Tax=Zea mays TaxID=4577 RepID=C4J873_MAIZE|nr:unknown [Zea mays]
MLARGGEAVSLWLPPPTAGGGGFLGGADRYLTREEHWMNQTLDHFNPTDHRVEPNPGSLQPDGPSAIQTAVLRISPQMYRKIGPFGAR